MTGLALCLLLASLAAGAGQELPEDPNKAAIDSKIATYHRLSDNLSRPLSERVLAMSDSLLQDVIEGDRSIGIGGTGDYSTRPASVEELALVQQYVALLPRAYREAFEEKLLAIFLVDEFAGAGLTSWVVDEAGGVYYFMILNTALFEQSLDDWLSFRADSVFDASPVEPRIRISTGTDYLALMYGLLHEGGHLVDYELGITPYVDDLHRQVIGGNTAATAFSAPAWESISRPWARYHVDNSQQMNTYGIYANAGFIPRQLAPVMFGQLRRTPFVSIYSLLSWAEHLADFVTYYHIEQFLHGTVEMLLVDDGGEVVAVYRPMQTDLAKSLAPSIQVLYQ